MTFIEKNIVKVLEEKRISYELFEHEPVYTSEQAAKIRNEPLSSGVKSLVLKTREGKFILALVPGDERADLKKIAKLENTKKVRLADPKEVLKMAGCEIGAVSPFGQTTKLKTYMNKDILKNELINFSAGSHTKSIKIKVEDLVKLVNPVFV